jgi:hypothetical protein
MIPVCRANESSSWCRARSISHILLQFGAFNTAARDLAAAMVKFPPISGNIL